jgi:GNAT superfamily N-acetyltransferase
VIDILDADGGKHTLFVADKVKLDDHLVANVERRGSGVTLDRYDIPKDLQGKGIGSALLKQLEMVFHHGGGTRLTIRIKDTLCPIYGGFFTKHGYVQHGEEWTKTLTLRH